MSAPPLVDTHAHLMDPAFDVDRPAVVERARAAGVLGLVLVGYDLDTSRRAIELARGTPGACATVGIHPNAAAACTDADLDRLAELARQPEVVAIGETGLDFYRHHTPPSRQREVLAWHLRLAEELAVPAIIHNRQADADVAAALEHSAARRPPGQVPGVLHCFTSTDRGYLDRLLAVGCFVSFAGPLTFKNAPMLREMAGLVPLERLLIETDCPYLAPGRHRGQRNEPAYLVETAACLAALRGLPFERLAEQLWANASRVFPALARLGRVAEAVE